MNKPLSRFGAFFAGFGAVMLLIDMLVPHAEEKSFNVAGVSGPVGWGLFVVGAVFFLLAVKPEAIAAVPFIGKWFQEKPTAPGGLNPADRDPKG